MKKIISNTSIFPSVLLFILFLSSQNLIASYYSTQLVGDLQLQMRTNTTAPSLFEKLEYRVFVKNIGEEKKTEIIVNTEVPSGTVFSTATTKTGHYDQQSNKWIIDVIENDASVELILSVIVVEPNIEIINIAWFDFSTHENLIAELGENGTSIDQRVSITLTAKSEEAPTDYITYEAPDFIKDKKEGIWKVHPIIADEKLTVELVNRSAIGQFKIDFVNEFGAIVFREDIVLKRGKNKIEFDLDFIKSGKYHLKFNGKEAGTWEHNFYKK